MESRTGLTSSSLGRPFVDDSERLSVDEKLILFNLAVGVASLILGLCFLIDPAYGSLPLALISGSLPVVLIGGGLAIAFGTIMIVASKLRIDSIFRPRGEGPWSLGLVFWAVGAIGGGILGIIVWIVGVSSLLSWVMA